MLRRTAVFIAGPGLYHDRARNDRPATDFSDPEHEESQPVDEPGRRLSCCRAWEVFVVSDGCLGLLLLRNRGGQVAKADTFQIRGRSVGPHVEVCRTKAQRLQTFHRCLFGKFFVLDLVLFFLLPGGARDTSKASELPGSSEKLLNSRSGPLRTAALVLYAKPGSAAS